MSTVFYLWVCVDRWGLGGLGSHDSHTRIPSHTHSFSPPPPLGPRRCLAPCRAARLLHWVPGWPVLFPCSNAPFVFVLLFWEWKKGAIQWGEWWIGGRENERATERDIDTERERERQGERERNPGVSFVVSAVKAQQGEPPRQFVRRTLIFQGCPAPRHCGNSSHLKWNK